MAPAFDPNSTGTYDVGYAQNGITYYGGFGNIDGNAIYYIPNSGFTGLDSFTYMLLSDGSVISTATVYVTVLSPGQDMLSGTQEVSDTFKFVSSDITAADVITNFETGAGGDKLDLHDLLSGFAPATSALSDFARLTAVGSSTMVSVDVDGAAGGANFVDIVSLQNTAGVTLTDLLAQRNIIV